MFSEVSVRPPTGGDGVGTSGGGGMVGIAS